MPILLQLNLIAAIIYCAATGFTKVSVLIFYLRIFPSRNFHVAVWTIVFIAAGYSIASILANIFSCNPIAKSWDLTITTGSCMNRPVFYFANAGLGIFTDFATVAVPMYVTLREPLIRVLLTEYVQTLASPTANAHPSEDCRWCYFGHGMLVSWRRSIAVMLLLVLTIGQSSVGIVSCIRLGSLYTLLESTDLTCKTYTILS